MAEPQPGRDRADQTASETATRSAAEELILTFAAGATDAVSFMALGNVFASVMTGNIVLFGVSAGRRHATLAVHAGIAFLGYVTGTVSGTRVWLEGRDAAQRRQGETAAFATELVLLLGLLVGWELTSGRPAGTTALLLLALASTAMGIQSAAVRRLPFPTSPTTYLTGTLTHVFGSVAMGASITNQWRSAAALLAMLVGAGATATLVVEARRAAPVPGALAVAVVIGAGLTHHRLASPRRRP